MEMKTERPTPAPEVLSAARQWLAPVRERLGHDLVAAYLTGGVLQPDFDPQRRAVNVLVLVRELGLERLDSLASALPRASRPPHLDPLFVTLRQMERSLDVFPIEWTDLRERHWLLEGEDVLGSLVAPATHLRLQIEQELRGKHLRLVQAYLAGAERHERLHAALSDAASGFHTLFRALVRLNGEPTPPTFEALVERVAAIHGLDAVALGGPQRLRAAGRAPSADETRAVFRAFLAQVERLTASVDGLRVP